MAGNDIVGLKKLREPFDKKLIGKLPKPTKQQTEEVKKNFKAGIRCDLCGGWHHPKVVHLDYVGHAAVTDRLLEVDPFWEWEPLSVDEGGLPRFDANGGLWIKLTILGMTRTGYGHPDKKTGGDAVKEAIGDAIRNAAMRFGVALDLWHKGDLHVQTQDEDGHAPIIDELITDEQADEIQQLVKETGTKGHELLKYAGADMYKNIKSSRYTEIITILKNKLSK